MFNDVTSRVRSPVFVNVIIADVDEPTTAGSNEISVLLKLSVGRSVTESNKSTVEYVP